MLIGSHSVAQAILPASLYARLSASAIAKRLARGSVWAVFGSATSRVLVLVAMIFVARILGPASYGELGLIQATISVVGLMAGIGLGNTATRFVAEFVITDPRRAASIIALLAASTIGMVLIASAVLVLAATVVADGLLGAPHLRATVMWASLLLASNVFRTVQGGILAGFERFGLIAKLNVLEGVLALVMMIVLTNLLGVVGAVLGLASSGMVVWIVGQYLLTSEYRQRHIAISYRGCWRNWPILTDYGLPNLIANLAATPILWLSMTILAKSAQGYTELGHYHAAYQWFGPVIFLPMAAFSASIPVLVQEWAARRRQRFRKLASWLCGLALALSLPPVVIISLFSQQIMDFYGPEYSGAWHVLVVLMAAAPFQALAKIASGMLLTMNRAWTTVWPSVAWGSVLLSLAAWLIPVHGALGLAIAFLSAYVILAGTNLTLLLAGARNVPAIAGND